MKRTLVLFALVFPLAAARADLIPRKILFGNPEKAGPEISPDGKLLAYLAPEKGVLNVWIRTLGKDDDHVVTSDKKRGIRQYFWQPDSQHILYRQDQDGDENWHIYQTELATKITRDLTPFAGIQARVEYVDWEHPNEILVGINVRNPQLHDVYKVDLRTGALTMDTQNPGDVADFGVDNQMRVRMAQVATPDGGIEIRTREGAKAAWKTLVKWGPEESGDGALGFTPNDKSLLISTSVDANAARLVEIELASKRQKVIAEDKDYDAGVVMEHPKTHKLEAVSFNRDRLEWQAIDKGVGADLEALKKVHDGEVTVVSRDLADKTWVVSFVVDDGPVWWYLWDRTGKKATPLFSNQPALEKYKLAKMQPVTFPAKDGLNIHAYLTLPPGSQGKKVPLVLNVHGGPWARDTWGYRPEAQWLANRGYAVLQINYRGSTGYGKKYLHAGDREWAGKMQQDLLDGKAWAIAQGHVDPKKVCIYGGSYGGYATLVGVTFTPDAFACGVDIVGPSNILTLLKSIPPYWKPLVSIFESRVGKMSEEEFLKSRSPLFKANAIKVPLMIAQGASDPRVKQAESDQIVAAMRKNGKAVEYIVFPDEGHGFARPENRLKFYAAAEGFLARYLGGKADPPAADEKVDALRK
ncbi:MAG TPA: S9 family peptidase [Polyangia bacterium]|nr:S9 family peptidase [Polyangia bacterium]